MRASGHKSVSWRRKIEPGDYVFVAARKDADGSLTALRIRASRDGMRSPQQCGDSWRCCDLRITTLKLHHEGREGHKGETRIEIHGSTLADYCRTAVMCVNCGARLRHGLRFFQTTATRSRARCMSASSFSRVRMVHFVSRNCVSHSPRYNAKVSLRRT